VKLLLDTNILIPLEPGSLADIERSTANAARLSRFAQEVVAEVFIHAQQTKDIDPSMRAGTGMTCRVDFLLSVDYAHEMRSRRCSWRSIRSLARIQ